jgi:hypothetical protein
MMCASIGGETLLVTVAGPRRFVMEKVMSFISMPSCCGAGFVMHGGENLECFCDRLDAVTKP